MRVSRKLGLVLVAICLVPALLVLVVPCTLDKLNETYAGRIKADMRSTAHAIEEFRAKERHYPGIIPMASFTSNQHALGELGVGALYTIDPGTSSVPGLTTPVAYITSLFTDVFAQAGNQLHGDRLPLAYYTDGKRWILFSIGFDGMYQIRPRQILESTSPTTNAKLLNWTFDVTNGAISRGDIGITGP